MITIVSGKGAPGATTTLAALAAAWPAPVLLADCDPDGGDLAPGWLLMRNSKVACSLVMVWR
jgi:MinD superfamily P-loop ATPase